VTGPLVGDLVMDAWRDYSPDPQGSRQMHVGIFSHTDEPDVQAQRMFDDGIRCVRLLRPVVVSDACSRQSVRDLRLVAEMTSIGMVVDWCVDWDDSPKVTPWDLLTHLYPPARIGGLPDSERIQRQWRHSFSINKCAYRLGAGFWQVWDRRWGGLTRFTIDQPDLLQAITAVRAGADEADIDAPERSLHNLSMKKLIGRVGTVVWWLPYRCRRWPGIYRIKGSS
jgi:hypothetical protein